MATKTKGLNTEDVERAVANCKKLPERCYVYIDGNPVGQRIGIVANSEAGYTPFSQADGDKDTPISVIKHVVLEQNEKLGVTPAQMSAMKVGSMFGFHVGGADPDSETNIRIGAAFVQDASTWQADLDAKYGKKSDDG